MHNKTIGQVFKELNSSEKGISEKEIEARLKQYGLNEIKEGKKNTDEMQLLRSIRQKIDFIKSNPFYGDNIPKEQIPKEYKVQNLWRVELSQFWRMLYTIKGDQIEIICFVLDILDHKNYDKKFGYKKK